MTLDQLQALLDAATPGEWAIVPSRGAITVRGAGKQRPVAEMWMTDPGAAEANAALIVAMRNELPRLIACVRAADAMRKAGATGNMQAIAYDTARCALARREL